MTSKIRKWFLGSVIGVVVLALLTNVIWEVLKPLSGGIIVFIIRVTTLGIKKLNDSIYKEIARGLHENTSLQIYVIVTGLVLGLVFIILIGSYLSLRRDKQKDEIVNRNSWIERIFRSKKMLYFSFIYGVFLLCFLSLDAVQTIYINRSVTYYFQIITIINPNISDQQYKVFNSRFSQIENSKDYLKIITEIEKFAKENNIVLPRRPSLL